LTKVLLSLIQNKIKIYVKLYAMLVTKLTKRTCSEHYYCCATVLFVRSERILLCANSFKCALFTSAQNCMSTI